MRTTARLCILIAINQQKRINKSRGYQSQQPRCDSNYHHQELTYKPLIRMDQRLFACRFRRDMSHEGATQPLQHIKTTSPRSSNQSHKKPLKVRQNASNLMRPFRPAAPALMRLRPWRKFESKEPYIAGRCGGGTTARAGPKW